MNPAEAKDLIAELIEEHGPECASPRHFLALKGGEVIFVHEGQDEAKGAEKICDVGKSGMKHGFTAGLWAYMGEAVSKAVGR